MVFDEDFEKALAKKTAEWRPSFRLANAYDESVFADLALNRTKLDRAAREESFLKAHYMERAKTFWKSDRQMEAEELAAKISENPPLIVLRLKKTAHGADWLIREWERLLLILELGGTWDESQRETMCDLAGISHMMRNNDDPTGTEPGCPEAIAFVRSEINVLREHKRDGLDEFDDIHQQAAESGFPIEIPKPLDRVRRSIVRFTKGSDDAIAILFKNGRYTSPKLAHPEPSPSRAVAFASSRPPPVSLPPPPPEVAPQSTQTEETLFTEDHSTFDSLPNENRRARKARQKLARSR